MTPTANTPQPASNPNPAPEQDSGRTPADRLIVRIDRYTLLAEMLSKPRLMWYVAGLTTLLLTFLFVGLTLAAITLKRIYPYNDFQTNAWGAMMIRTEEKDITYWLFNTAELWANSGIRVEEGDMLTIRASGRTHTAIHHLVENARDNTLLADPWSDTEGFEHKESERDQLRAKWRVIPHKPQDALIMWIAPPEAALEETPDKSRLYLIGKERTNFRVAQSGELRFAVNDIVLTPSNIYRMVVDHLKTIAKGDPEGVAELKRLSSMPEYLITQDTVKTLFKFLARNTPRLKELYENKKSAGYAFGPHPKFPKGNEIDCNELSYYNDTDYRNAWYDDNIGSFLIVIERKKQ